jgi:uncharacterized membrane protein required for colicin V production
MANDIISHINWVDLFVLIILLRGCYIAVQTGFIVEFFKLLGLVLAVFFSFHYYTPLVDLLKKKAGLGSIMPLAFADFLSFIFICGGVYLIIVAARKSILGLFKVEAPSLVNKWGSLVLGIFRSMLLAGLVIFILVISSVDYLKNCAVGSFSGKKFFKVPVAVYSGLWNGVGSKFLPNEHFNKTVYDVENELWGK